MTMEVISINVEDGRGDISITVAGYADRERIRAFLKWVEELREKGDERGQEIAALKAARTRACEERDALQVQLVEERGRHREFERELLTRAALAAQETKP